MRLLLSVFKIIFTCYVITKLGVNSHGDFAGRQPSEGAIEHCLSWCIKGALAASFSRWSSQEAPTGSPSAASLTLPQTH